MKKKIVIVIFISIAIILGGVGLYVNLNKGESKPKEDKFLEVDNNLVTKNIINNNELSEFDLYFLNEISKDKNTVYSPMSIKYALKLIDDMANGESKDQIAKILNNYKITNFNNNDNITNLSTIFITNNFKNSVNKSFKSDVNSDIVYYKTNEEINKYISNKTNNKITKIVEGEEYDFIVNNSLLIDMEWKNRIQALAETKPYFNVHYSHEDFSATVSSFEERKDNFTFNDMSNKDYAEFVTVVNKYDIINTIGLDNIKNDISTRYNNWLASGSENACDTIDTTEEYVNKYISEISANYKKMDSSTDYRYYIDDEVKVFSKELKEYNGTELEYIGIMPIKQNLNAYVNNLSVDKINNLINSLISIEYNNFEEGYITYIHGRIPLFKYNYDLELTNSLKKLNIQDVFSYSKSDLSNIFKTNVYLDNIKNSTEISFTNDGIKASSITSAYGYGAGDCGFDYLFVVPVKEIDMTIDKPFIYLIRDKNTKEIWFIGSVNDARDYTSMIKGMK